MLHSKHRRPIRPVALQPQPPYPDCRAAR